MLDSWAGVNCDVGVIWWTVLEPEVYFTKDVFIVGLGKGIF